MAGWGDVPTGSKNIELNQPKAREPCTMHCTCHKKNRVESRALQANSCDNLNKGYCKLGQVKGGCSGRERVNSYAPPNTQGTRRTRPWIHGGTGVCKARFQGPASSCSRWLFSSFTLSGFTNHVRLHPAYPCILGLSTNCLPPKWSLSERTVSISHLKLVPTADATETPRQKASQGKNSQ